MHLNNNIVVVYLQTHIFLFTDQETYCIKSHFKFWASANEWATNWLYVTFPGELDCYKLVVAFFFTADVPLL